MNLNGKRLAAGAAACIAALAAVMAWIDRPLALFVHAHFQGSLLFPALTAPGGIAPPLATAWLAIAGCAAVTGWRPGPLARAALMAAVAVLLAAALKDQLKYAFGRTWPETWAGYNPSFIRDGVFGFAPFHGGVGWSAFPSGHVAVVAAPAAAVWQRLPWLRWPAVAVVAAVAVGLLGGDYHWLSDILAGGLLGAAVGRGVAALMPCGAAAQDGAGG